MLYRPVLWGFRVEATVDQLPSIARQGISPLYWAAENESLHMARVLLSCGADVSAVDEKGTPETTTAQRPYLKRQIIESLKEIS